MRELYHTEDIFPNERDRRQKKKKTRGGKKLFRVLNTLNVWVVLVSPSEEILLFCALYLRCKYYRYVSHSLSLSLRNIFARREISVCLLLSVFFRVVVVAFS